jgi:phosphatidylethanolamine/phosphatidyl-N-methylethanolamine N-methyltransferase
MNVDSIRGAYRRYAKYYDTLFGPVLHPGRQQVVRNLGLRPGQRVLEVGVGTGLSLPLYPADVRVTGIDISPHMLELARQRVLERGLTQAEGLHEMDAAALKFPDGSFDKAVAMYVMSVVPDPVRVVQEMRRVCRSGGEIFIVNHFHSRRPLVRQAERLLAPLSRVAGFRPDLGLDEFIRENELDVMEIHRVNLLGYWKVLHCRIPPATILEPSELAAQALQG